MKNKKVILINRPLIRVKGLRVPNRKWQPLNLAYIAAILEKEGIICQIVDARVLELTVEEIIHRVKNFQPDLVIFATDPADFYQCPNPNWQTIKETTQGIRQVTEAKILSLGPQVSLFDKKLMSKLPIDFAVKGDNSLLTAQAAIDILRQGRTRRPGISYFEGDKFVSGKMTPLIDLSALPLPAYHLLPMEKYSSNMKFFPLGKFSIIISARGCPFHCKYCFKNMITDLVRTRDLDLVMQEIDVLINDYNIKAIFFFDEIFSFYRERVIDLCQRIIKSGHRFKWGCQSRVDYIDEELLKLMQQSGCRYISYGIESGSQRIVDLADKKIDLKRAGEIVELTNKVGIFPHINMMYGFPGETKEDFKKTIDFMIKHSREDFPLAKIDFFVGTPYYNEYLADKSHQEAVAISQELSLSQLKRPEAEKEIARWMIYRRWQKKKFDKMFFYYIAKYLLPGLILKLKAIRGQPY